MFKLRFKKRIRILILWGKNSAVTKQPEPLRVCKPCVVGKHLLRFFGRFGVVLVLTVGVLVIPTPEGLSLEGHRAIAASVFTAALLALQPVSLSIAGLMVPVALVVLGLVNSTQTFEPFSRPIIFLILGYFFGLKIFETENMAILSALICLICSFVLLKILNQFLRKSKSFHPQLIK